MSHMCALRSQEEARLRKHQGRTPASHTPWGEGSEQAVPDTYCYCCVALMWFCCNALFTHLRWSLQWSEITCRRFTSYLWSLQHNSFVRGSFFRSAQDCGLYMTFLSSLLYYSLFIYWRQRNQDKGILETGLLLSIIWSLWLVELPRASLLSFVPPDFTSEFWLQAEVRFH